MRYERLCLFVSSAFLCVCVFAFVQCLIPFLLFPSFLLSFSLSLFLSFLLSLFLIELLLFIFFVPAAQALVTLLKGLPDGENLLKQALQELELSGTTYADFHRHYSDALTMRFLEITTKVRWM